MDSFFDPILESLRLTWSQLRVVSPRVFGALLFLIVGWWIAKTLRKLAIRFLRLVGVEAAAERSGIEDFLLRGGVRFTTVTLIANAFYWLLMLIVAVAVFNVLGLPVTPELVAQVSAYLPNVLVALVIVVFGTILARFLGGVVHTYLSNIGVHGSHAIGVLAQAAVLTFVVTMALQQLKIGGDVLLAAFQLAFGALCLALALAFGLGGREWAASLIAKTWKAR